MRILCDIDGVVAHFVKRWVEIVNERSLSRFKHPIETHHVTNWNLHMGTGVDKDSAVSVFQEKGFFESLEVIEGSQQVLKHLHDKGHEIYFVTHCKPSCKDGFGEKLDWVDKHFGFIGSSKVVLTGEKHLVYGDVLIDDHIDNLRKWEAEWSGHGYGICFDAPYNQDFEGERAKNWLDVLELVAKGDR